MAGRSERRLVPRERPGPTSFGWRLVARGEEGSKSNAEGAARAGG